MSWNYTEIASDVFKNLEMNSGVLLSEFNPETPASSIKDNIICATTGDITIKSTPTFVDLGDDINNCPKNVKELKSIESWEHTIAFTALDITAATLKLALGCATVTTNSTKSTIAPNRQIASTDFNTIWWVGDRNDGGFVAVKIENALSTDGLSLSTTDKGKGNLAVTMTAHYSMSAPETSPVTYYVVTAATSGT